MSEDSYKLVWDVPFAEEWVEVTIHKIYDSNRSLMIVQNNRGGT